MFIVYCLEEEIDGDFTEESEKSNKEIVDATNALSLLHNLDLPHTKVTIQRRDVEKINYVRNLISKVRETGTSTNKEIFFPQIFSVDITDHNEEKILNDILNFQPIDVLSETIYYVGQFSDFRELILRLLRLSPEVTNGERGNSEDEFS